MSNAREWYSAKVRLVCSIESVGATSVMECLHVFRARDWDAALQRAIQLGRGHEEQYVNSDGLSVRWELKDVETLDLIRAEPLDGAEVYSAVTEIPEDEKASFEEAFQPEKSSPIQTF